MKNMNLNLVPVKARKQQKRNKKSREILVFIVFLPSFLFCGCANVMLSVSVRGDRKTNFEQYKQYTIVDFVNMVNSKGKVTAYNDFEDKEVFVELAEKKLKSMGFIRDDNEPDFAVWVGGSIEYESESYSTTNYEMIPTGTSGDGHPIYTIRENKEEHSWDGYGKSLVIMFFDTKNIPEGIKAQEIFILPKILSRESWDNLSAEKQKRMLKIMSKLLGKEIASFSKVKDFKAELLDKVPLKESSEMWGGCGGYFNDIGHFEEEIIPFLVDTILNFYPKKNKTRTVPRFLNKELDWLEE